MTARALIAKGAAPAEMLAARKDAVVMKALVENYYGKDRWQVVRTGEDGGRELRVIAPPDLTIAPEQAVGLRLDPARLHRFDPATGRRVN